MSAVVADRTMWADLVEAFGELSELTRSRTARVDTRSGPGYTYTYADLGDALSAVRPVLARHGFAVTQPVAFEQNVVHVSTTLLHRSGERFETPWLSFVATGTPQVVGSVITYGRRYSLMAALGLGTDDDDGAAASSAPARSPSASVQREPAPPPSPADHPPVPSRAAETTEPQPTPRSSTQSPQQRKLHALLSDLHLSGRDMKLSWCSQHLGREVSSSDDLTEAERARLIDIAEELRAHDPWAPQRETEGVTDE